MLGRVVTSCDSCMTCRLRPQSLYLTSVLIKFIWSNGGTYSSVLDNVIKSLAGGDVSSSENSISMDASDDEVSILPVPRRPSLSYWSARTRLSSGDQEPQAISPTTSFLLYSYSLPFLSSTAVFYSRSWRISLCGTSYSLSATDVM